MNFSSKFLMKTVSHSSNGMEIKPESQLKLEAPD